MWRVCIRHIKATENKFKINYSDKTELEHKLLVNEMLLLYVYEGEDMGNETDK